MFKKTAMRGEGRHYTAALNRVSCFAVASQAAFFRLETNFRR